MKRFFVFLLAVIMVTGTFAAFPVAAENLPEGLYFVDIDYDTFEVAENPYPVNAYRIDPTSVTRGFLAYYDGQNYTLLTTDDVEITGNPVKIDDYDNYIQVGADKSFGTTTFTYKGFTATVDVVLPEIGLYSEKKVSEETCLFEFSEYCGTFYILPLDSTYEITSVESWEPDWYGSYYDIQQGSDGIWSVTLTPEAHGSWLDTFRINNHEWGISTYWFTNNAPGLCTVNYYEDEDTFEIIPEGTNGTDSMYIFGSISLAYVDSKGQYNLLTDPSAVNVSNDCVSIITDDNGYLKISADHVGTAELTYNDSSFTVNVGFTPWSIYTTEEPSEEGMVDTSEIYTFTEDNKTLYLILSVPDKLVEEVTVQGGWNTDCLSVTKVKDNVYELNMTSSTEIDSGLAYFSARFDEIWYYRCSLEYTYEPAEEPEEPVCEHANTSTTVSDIIDETCTENGSYIRTITCDDCGEVVSTETVTVYAPGHNFVDGVCTVCGAEDPDAVVIPEETADPEEPAEPETPADTTVILENFEVVDESEAKDFEDFEDIEEESWYEEGAEIACEYGLMIGVSETEFNPTGTFTLAEALTVASRINDTYFDNKTDFTAGDTEKWYAGYMTYAFDKDIIGADQFENVEAVATRAQFAEMLAACLPDTAFTVVNDFTFDDIPDVNGDESYADAVLKLYRAGILIGTDDIHTFNAEGTLTRAEVAVMISRVVVVSSRIAVNSAAE